MNIIFYIIKFIKINLKLVYKLTKEALYEFWDFLKILYNWMRKWNWRLKNWTFQSNLSHFIDYYTENWRFVLIFLLILYFYIKFFF